MGAQRTFAGLAWSDKKKSVGGKKKWGDKPKRPGDARPAWVKAKMGDFSERKKGGGG